MLVHFFAARTCTLGKNCGLLADLLIHFARPLVGCVYVSIFTSGGMDSSRRYIPEQAEMYQSCDLESDPSCRYN